jgi:hypothetical protein
MAIRTKPSLKKPSAKKPRAKSEVKLDLFTIPLSDLTLKDLADDRSHTEKSKKPRRLEVAIQLSVADVARIAKAVAKISKGGK